MGIAELRIEELKLKDTVEEKVQIDGDSGREDHTLRRLELARYVP